MSAVAAAPAAATVAPAAPPRASAHVLRWAAAMIAIPAAVYLPGFVLALPTGFAVSLPFWAQAKDYTCSSTRTESLMVRVNPYVAPKAGRRNGDWDCRRIALLGARDIGAGGEAADDGAYYVRIYTPTPKPPARAEGADSPASQALFLPSRAAPRPEPPARAPQRSSQQASP
ncbi:MAG: hypothetical protein JNK46_06305 [Methylobacteriaceae bacterium]|nr:hypothetical protein [Methylobacteriaceae bacterium]